MTSAPDGGPAGATITLVQEFPHPPAKVWRALTDPALLPQWLMVCDLPAGVFSGGSGGRFRFQAVPPSAAWDGVVHCEVLTIEPLKRLRYTWCGGPGAFKLDTVVTWTLSATATGTRLELEHSGFKPEQGYASAGAGQGWTMFVGTRLAEVLAKTP